MAEHVMIAKYDTSIDRAGLALGTGAAIGGAVSAVLVGLGGNYSPFAIAVGFVVGAMISAMTIIAIGGPIWMICHALGQRGPWTAMMVGAVAGFALFLGGQTYGFGLFDMPVTDARTLMFRWLSGMATSLILAIIAAIIALAMWRVAYRRVR